MLPKMIARLIASAWAGWWALFGLLSGLGEGLDLVGVLMHSLVPGGIFILATAIVWRWETVGGVLLVAIGLATIQYYPFASSVLGAMTLSLPPTLAGFIFLWDGLQSHRPNNPPHTMK